jgi:ATP synthase protein I
LAAQAAAGVLCALLAWGITQRSEVAVSALYGVAATVVPNALFARAMTRRSLTAVTAAAKFLLWEMVKIGVAVALLVAAPRIVPQLSWPALLVAMLVCIKVNWLALLWQRKPRQN